MSYDFCILNTDGKPGPQVSLGVQEHFQIVELAKHMKASKLSKIEDYYSDVDFSQDEINILMSEITALLKEIEAEIPIFLKLKAIFALCHEARRKNCGICTIAD